MLKDEEFLSDIIICRQLSTSFVLKFRSSVVRHYLYYEFIKGLIAGNCQPKFAKNTYNRNYTCPAYVVLSFSAKNLQI